MSESENKETGKLGFGLMRLQRKVFSTDIPQTKKMAKQQSYTSLERAGAGYFDHYLLHSLMGFTYNRYEKLGIC